MPDSNQWAKELDIIIPAARAAGWRVERTADGWAFYPADKSLTPVFTHLTYSDWRSVPNVRSMLRQRGLTWAKPAGSSKRKKKRKGS